MWHALLGIHSRICKCIRLFGLLVLYGFINVGHFHVFVFCWHNTYSLIHPQADIFFARERSSNRLRHKTNARLKFVFGSQQNICKGRGLRWMSLSKAFFFRITPFKRLRMMEVFVNHVFLHFQESSKLLPNIFHQSGCPWTTPHRGKVNGFHLAITLHHQPWRRALASAAGISSTDTWCKSWICWSFCWDKRDIWKKINH